VLDSQSVQLKPFFWVKNLQTEMFPTLEEDETVKRLGQFLKRCTGTG